MNKNRIQQIQKDINAYQEAIENAEGALAEAERELDEALAEYDTEDSMEDYPEYNRD